MKYLGLKICITFCLCISVPQAMALSDSYYATGEDLDYLIESDNTLGVQELEYELRKFVLFRKLEDYLFNLSLDYYDETS